MQDMGMGWIMIKSIHLSIDYWKWELKFPIIILKNNYL